MDNNWLDLLQNTNQLTKVVETNKYTEQFGLTLSQQDAQLILDNRKKTLSEQKRVEFGEGITPKIIHEFCDSDFIDQNNYVDTIIRLQEIFYLYKNESMDELTDDELINIMRNAFDEECQGSLEYLEETFLDNFARDIRANTNRFIGRYTRDDEKI